MFINLCEPISAVEMSPYSGMQSTDYWVRRKQMSTDYNISNWLLTAQLVLVWPKCWVSLCFNDEIEGWEGPCIGRVEESRELGGSKHVTVRGQSARCTGHCSGHCT